MAELCLESAGTTPGGNRAETNRRQRQTSAAREPSRGSEGEGGVAALCSLQTGSSVCNRNFVDLVTFLIDDVDEPAVPVPSWHDIAVLEVACQRQRILTSGGLPRQIKTLVIVEDLLAISQTEIVTRHCEWPPPYSAQPYQGARGPSYSTRNLPGSESTAVS